MPTKPTKNQPTPPPDQLTANKENQTSEISEKAKAAATNQASQPAKADPKTTPKTEAKKKKPWSAPVLQFLDEENNTDGKTDIHTEEDSSNRTTVNGMDSKTYYSNPS